MELQKIFDECLEKHASDIHIKEGERILFRSEGKMIPSIMEDTPDRITMFDFLYTMVYGKKEKISGFKHNMEMDFGYIHTDGCSYRGNTYMYMGRIGIALRKIPSSIKNLVELGIPKSLGKILQAKQ